MDDARFDDVSRRFGSAASRRGLFRRLATGVGVLSLGSVGLLAETEAGRKRRKRRRRCRKKTNRTFCGATCVRGTCCSGKPCGGGNCFCREAIEGDAFCAANAIIECTVGTCISSSGCPAGRRCVRLESGSEFTCCQPVC